MKQWTDQELIELATMYADSHLSHADLEQHFGFPFFEIRSMAIQLGIGRKRIERWTLTQDALVRQLYVDEDIAVPELVARIGHSWRGICHRANLFGLRRPKPNRVGVVRDYFYTIDTAEKAYWLGFIAADGTVDDRPRRYSLCIDLQPRDRHWLEKFRDTVAPGATITYHPGRSYSVTIASQELIRDIVRYGIGRRKSSHLLWPSIPAQYEIPFLLGYFDGDGTFTPRTSRPGYQWMLLGTEPLLTVAREVLIHHVGVPLKQPVRHNKNVSPHLYHISANGPRAVVIDRVLNASGLGLPRKHLPLE